MYFRFSTLLPIAALAAVAAAAPGEIEARGGGQCNTGNTYCCNSSASVSDTLVTELAGLLGLNLSGITGLVGLTCTSVVGALTGSTCGNQQPVCCTGNSNNNGLIVFQCNSLSV